MGEYSNEPSTRDLVLHLTFDTIEGDRVLDESPQGNDAQASLDIETGTGRVGQALESPRTVDQEVDVNNPEYDFGGHDRFTVAAWVRPDDLSETDFIHLGNFRIILGIDGGSNVYVYFHDGSSSYTADADVSGRAGEWMHVAGVLDPNDGELRLYIDGEEVSKKDTTASVRTDNDNKWNIAYRGANSSRHLVGAIDEVRVRRNVLTDERIKGLHEMGVQKHEKRDLKQAWANDGIPFQGENIRMATSLAAYKTETLRQADRVLDARHIDQASGKSLDRLAAHAGTHRRTGESDPKLRARIKGILAAGRSNGTFEDVLETTAVLVETTEDRIFIDTNYDTDPGTIFVYVRTNDLNDANLTAATIETILNDAVAAGHIVHVVERGANPFELTDDSTANDSKKGLTSDGIATGGGLVSDA